MMYWSSSRRTGRRIGSTSTPFFFDRPSSIHHLVGFDDVAGLYFEPAAVW